MLSLPRELAEPVVIGRKVASKVMFDLTVYLKGPSEPELEYLIDYYESICPPDRFLKYTIGEIEDWPTLANPELTASGRAAAAAGIRRPYLEPVRQRIRDGRAFEIQFWDGRPIEDPNGSWSFNCRRIHLRETGLHAFVRILVPLQADCEVLRSAALSICENVELYSGHGGLTFAYDPWLKEAAFDAIYAQARRFWGVDVEDLNATLPHVRKGIKGINWITLVGRPFNAVVEENFDRLRTVPQVLLEQRHHGWVIVAGSEPVPGDQHRPDRSLDSYYAIANALEPLFLREHPDFSGQRFIEHGNTINWIRRFLEPEGWR